MKAAIAIVGIVAAFALGGYLLYLASTEERIDILPSRIDDTLAIVDDNLDDKRPVFATSLVDRRMYEGWQINNSYAVFRLDCPDVVPHREGRLLTLYASYADTAKAAAASHLRLLPSANMLDGLGTVVELKPLYS